MDVVTIRCPECGATITSTDGYQPGQLLDCPRCRLLFAPAPDEVHAPNDRRESRPVHPRSSPWSAPKRRPSHGPSEMVLVFVAAGVMLALVGIVVGAYVLYLRGAAARSSPSHSAPMTSQPAIAAPSGDGAQPTRAVEVEDPNAMPRRPVPQLDDPPVRGGAPKDP
jgi:hypothetical protein